MPLDLILFAAALAALSGLPGLLLDRRSSRGESFAACAMVAAAVVGLVGVAWALGPYGAASDSLTARLLGGAPLLAADPLSAFFAAPVLLMGALGSVYGLGYWRQARHAANGRRLRCFWGLLVAGMLVLLIARHTFAFLLGWEFMALSAFLLVGTEDQGAPVRQAAWVYLVATHISTLSLFAMFALLRQISGTFAWVPLAVTDAGLGRLTVVFALALIAFGLKAGLMPGHFWLPGAHANAPSHVSAMLSGVVLKMGIYGLVRITAMLPDPPVSWGGLLLLMGVVSGVLGVVFALGQHDLKRLLAYHSVENIGIIAMGLGLAMIGRSLDRPEWVVLGLAGCLLHVWNHGLFKSLLFLSAGSVVHAAHTREIDRLGGLAKSMKWTAAGFLVGAVAICGLPPLNGFVSELLVYMGLMRTVGVPPGAACSGVAAAAPALALIGALAVACFVKAYGAVFLGSARSPAAVGCHEAPRSMLTPMAVLAIGCGAIGLAPVVFAPLLDRAVAAWLPAGAAALLPVAALAPLAWTGVAAGALLALLVAAVALAARRIGARAVSGTTWDCGYARPTARMQYTASSFAQSLVRMFAAVLRPRGHRVRLHAAFPSAAVFASHVDDLVLERHLLPAARRVEGWIGCVRQMQKGLTQHYMLYILVTVVVLLLWTLPLGEYLARLFAR